MKVVHLISGDLWAGAEVQAYTLLAQLSRQQDVELAVILLNDGRLARELRNIGIRVHVVDESRFGSLRILLAVRRILKEEQPAILHTHRYKENIIGALASRFAGRPRLVKTVHGLQERFSLFRQLKSHLYGALDYLVSRFCFDRIICVSEQMRGQLTRSFPARQLVCIRNGVDVDACVASKPSAAVRRELGLPDNARVVGTVARLVRIKGIEYLLQAVKIMSESLPEVMTVIVGDGPEREHLEKLAGQQGIANRVIFTGQRDDAFDLIAAMDVFVLPSLSEGIPMAVLEAMALGTPVVATRVGGVPEIIDDQMTGVLVNSEDPEELATAVQRLLRASNQTSQIRRAAGDAVHLQHSAGAMTQAVSSLYADVLVGR